jgi:hypothetical protein
MYTSDRLHRIVAEPDVEDETEIAPCANERIRGIPAPMPTANGVGEVGHVLVRGVGRGVGNAETIDSDNRNALVGGTIDEGECIGRMEQQEIGGGANGSRSELLFQERCFHDDLQATANTDPG